jgi:D-threo-aldose 1-dehydrogenase
MNDSPALVRLGQTGVRVPALGLGTGSFRGLYRDVPDPEAIETIYYALDHGLPMVDTAPWYGAFEAERIVGAALASRPRESYALATKACLWSENGEAMRGYTRDQVLWNLEGSLKRLQVDYVDILHVHDPVDEQFQTILDETLPTFVELRAQGTIRAIGCGTGDWRILERLAGEFDFDCMMLAGRYTLLEQEALEMLNALHERGVPVFSAGIYNSGILATGAVADAKYNYSNAPAEIIQHVERLSEICNRHRVPLKAAAAQFVRAHPAITTIIFGAETAAQVAENVGMFSVPIPPALWDDLRAEGLIPAGAPTPS